MMLITSLVPSLPSCVQGKGSELLIHMNSETSESVSCSEFRFERRRSLKLAPEVVLVPLLEMVFWC